MDGCRTQAVYEKKGYCFKEKKGKRLKKNKHHIKLIERDIQTKENKIWCKYAASED